jgi:hypothetical protein
MKFHTALTCILTHSPIKLGKKLIYFFKSNILQNNPFEKEKNVQKDNLRRASEEISAAKMNAMVIKFCLFFKIKTEEEKH